jgi:hypothetical protein
MGIYLIKLKREGALHNITMKVKQQTPAAAGAAEGKRLVIT